MVLDGTLMFGTGVDNSGFESGVNSLQAATTVALGNIGADIIRELSSAAAEIPKQVIAVGSTFEASMSNVAATMGISSAAEEFEMLSEAAKEAGNSTRFSAASASEALNYLALAGFDAEKSVAALPTVLNVAAAGGMELASASDMITDAMSALGLEMSDLNTFADQLSVTSQKSNTSVSQLGEAILTVGGTAKTLSGGVVEMNTALGILADNGIKGAEGGTALRNVILSLSAPTDTAAAALKNLGVSAFDASGTMRPLEDTFADLNTALATLSDQERTAVLNEIFNKVDLKSVNALLGTSADRFDELSGYISDCAGAAEQMAETMGDNLAGDITIMQSALEGLGISVYEKFQEPLRQATQEVTNFIGDLTKSVSDGKLGESIDRLAVGLGNLVSRTAELVADDLLPAAVDGIAWLAENASTLAEVAVPLVASVTAFNVAMKGFTIWQTAATAIQTLRTANEGATIAQIALNTAMEANPVGLVVAAVAALTAGLIAFMAVSSDATAKTEDYSRSLERARESGEAIVSSSDKEIALLRTKADRYEKLRQNYENLTDGEMAEFLDLAAELAEVLPEGTSVIDEQTGAYNNLESAIDGVIRKMEMQALLNAKYTEYEAAIANRYDIEKKLQQAENAWINDADGLAMIDDWKNVASYLYDDTSDESAKRAFMREYFRDEFAIDYEELDAILAENQEIIEEYNELSQQQYEEFNSGIEEINSAYNSTISDLILKFANNAIESYDEAAERISQASTSLLQEAWKQLDHEYAIGIIASDEDLYAKRLEAWNTYGDESNSDHWKYYEDLYDMEQDFAERSKKAAEEAAEAERQAMQDEWNRISNLANLGMISSEEAYLQQLEWIQKYCPEYSDEWYSYYQTIISYQREALQEQIKGIRSSLSDTISEYRSAFSELESSINSYKNRLLSVGSLFSIVTETDENGVETKKYSVENMRKQMAEMQKYHDYVSDLKNRGVSQEVLAELTNYDFDDGMYFAENLAKMSDAELKEITELYAQREQLADDLANELYAPEMEKLNTDLINSVVGQFGTLPEEIREIGAQALASFIEGISETENLSEGATDFVNDFFDACNEGISTGISGLNLTDSIVNALEE